MNERMLLSDYGGFGATEQCFGVSETGLVVTPIAIFIFKRSCLGMSADSWFLFEITATSSCPGNVCWQLLDAPRHLVWVICDTFPRHLKNTSLTLETPIFEGLLKMHLS